MVEFQFRELNETVTIEHLDRRIRLVRLRYANPFYGTCSIRLRFYRLQDGRPWIDPDSLQVENCQGRTETSKSLLHVAQRALVRLATRHPEILDFGGPFSGGLRPFARLQRWFLVFAPIRGLFSGESGDGTHKAPLT